MTTPDPLGLGLREFSYSLRECAPGGEYVYEYAVTIRRGNLTEYESPWENLQATTLEAARAEAQTRTALVAAMVQGARVESLGPRGVGDDGQPV